MHQAGEAKVLSLVLLHDPAESVQCFLLPLRTGHRRPFRNFPLGPRPSLQNLRLGAGMPQFVRFLLRYCADVRLLSNVHAGISTTGLPDRPAIHPPA